MPRNRTKSRSKKLSLTYQQFLSDYAKEFPGPNFQQRASSAWKRYKSLNKQIGGFNNTFESNRLRSFSPRSRSPSPRQEYSPIRRLSKIESRPSFERSRKDICSACLIDGAELLKSHKSRLGKQFWPTLMAGCDSECNNS